MPDNVTLFPVRGDITGIVRNNGKSEVIVQSGIETTSYTLDEGMIEFGTGTTMIHKNSISFLIHAPLCIHAPSIFVHAPLPLSPSLSLSFL